MPKRGHKGAIDLKIGTVATASKATAWGLAALLAVSGTQAAESEFTNPQKHFSIERPAALTAADAEGIYDRILDEVVRGYRLSGDPAAISYRSWQRFNTAPYRSATHGERFVNNYGNAQGLAYARFEAAGEMPKGTVLAKDSFAVTDEGNVFTGPLFLMEKMAAGFNPASRDWRYSMIMPDGSLFGVTKGQGSARVEFCITCHETAGDENDHLFFVPQDYRQAQSQETRSE